MEKDGKDWIMIRTGEWLNVLLVPAPTWVVPDKGP